MAVILRADNRTLLEGQKHSYTDANILSGVSSLLVANSAGFSADDYVLLGEFGTEGAELVQVQSVTSATHTLTFTAAIEFAHSESTRVTIIPYNQVKFYQTASTTFDASENPLSTVDVQADDTYTRYSDTANSTGYGWFRFYNETSAATTGESNAIPYANFTRDHVKSVVDSFRSLLNEGEFDLITHEDEMHWLNEAYSIACNELNLVNQEYKASDSYDISAVSGTKEYSLPSDFSNLISIYDSSGGTDSFDDTYVEFIAIDDVPSWDHIQGNVPRYYLRGSYIGFSPTPSDSRTYTIRYQAKTTELNSYYDTVDLPDNAVYCIKDFMMFRASQKTHRPNPQAYYELFTVGLNRMKIHSVKRHNNPDSWGIADNAVI